MPAMPMADSSAPIVVGISVTNSATTTTIEIRPARVSGEARDGRGDEDEDNGHAGEQDVERDLVGRLLPLGTFDQRDHAVEKGRALGRRNTYFDPIGDDEGTSRHC